MTESPAPSGTPDGDLAAVRARWAADLPALLGRAMDAYRAVAAKDLPADFENDDALKSFAVRQAACKQALGHIDGLIKLSRWAEPDGGTEDIDALIDRAEAELADVSEAVE